MTTTPTTPVRIMPTHSVDGVRATPEPKPRVFILPLIKQDDSQQYIGAYPLSSGLFSSPLIEFVTQDIERMLLEGKADLRFSKDEKKKIQSFEDLQKLSYSYTTVHLWALPAALVEREKISGVVEIFFRIKKTGYPARHYLELTFAIEDYRSSVFADQHPYSTRTQESTHNYHSYMIELTEKEQAQEALLLQRLNVLIQAVVEPEILRLFAKGPVTDTAVLTEIQKEYAVQLARIEQDVRKAVTEEYQTKITDLNIQLIKANANVIALRREKEALYQEIETKTAAILRNKQRTFSLDISNTFRCGVALPASMDPLFKAKSPLVSFQTDVGLTPYVVSANEKINAAVYADKLKHTFVLGIAGSHYSSIPDYYNPLNEHLLYESWDIQNYTLAGLLGYRFGYAPLEFFSQLQPGVDILAYTGKTEFGEERSSLNGYFSFGGTIGCNVFLPVENPSFKALLGLTYTLKNQFRGADGPDRLTQSLGVNITVRNIFDFYKKQE